MNVVWTPRSQQNLRAAARYLMQFNPSAALAMVRAVRAAPSRLARHPASGRPGRVEGTRELIVTGTPYILPYRISGGTIEILAVLHSSRQWPDQL